MVGEGVEAGAGGAVCQGWKVSLDGVSFVVWGGRGWEDGLAPGSRWYSWPFGSRPRPGQAARVWVRRPALRRRNWLSFMARIVLFCVLKLNGGFLPSGRHLSRSISQTISVGIRGSTEFIHS